MYEAETYEHAGLTVTIYYDADAGNPRKEFDQLATMVAFPRLAREYSLADRESTDEEDEAHDRRLGLLERYLRITEGAEVMFFYFADHGSGGARIYETDEDGASGFFYIPGDDIVREYGDDSPESREKARSVIEGEIKEMGQYVEGDVYGYIVAAPDGTDLESMDDSCWGFYGFEYAKEEANDAAEWLAKQLAAEAEPDLETTIYEETR